MVTTWCFSEEHVHICSTVHIHQRAHTPAVSKESGTSTRSKSQISVE